MPRTEVVFYREDDGHAPVLDWLRALAQRDRRAYAKGRQRIRQLEQLGYELRRPLADSLRNGIYELRVRRGHVNHRILYFFYGRNVAVLSHAFLKEDRVPDAAIELAIRRKAAYESDPERHTHDAGP